MLDCCNDALRRRRVICGGVHSLGNLNKIAIPADAQNITQKKAAYIKEDRLNRQCCFLGRFFGDCLNFRATKMGLFPFTLLPELPFLIEQSQIVFDPICYSTGGGHFGSQQDQQHNGGRN